jgi:hypothetical protein
MTMPPFEDSLAARIGDAGAALGIAVDPLPRHLEKVVDGPLVDAVVWTDADVAQLGLTASLTSHELLRPRRMTVLREGISGSLALPQLVVARPGAVWVERWSDRRAIATVVGNATLADDVAALEAISLAADTARTLGDRLDLLAGDAQAVRLLRASVRPYDVETYELGVQTDPDVVLRVLRNAATLHIPAAQLRLLEELHAELPRELPVMVGAGMQGATALPGVSIAYGAPPLDQTLRVLTRLTTRPDAAARFAALTRALGSERIAAVVLQLGLGPPMPVRFGVAVA